MTVRSVADTLFMPAKSQKRSKRAPRKASEPVDLFGHGSGRKVTVEGDSKCPDCGHVTHLRFVGHADSVGVRISRQAIKAGALCVPCTDRADQAELEAEIAERRDEMREDRVRRAGVPDRWQAVSFANVERDGARAEAIDAAVEWASSDDPRHGLLLWGDVGRGKTVIAAAAAMERLQRRRLRWLSIAKLLTDLRGGFDSPMYQQALRSIDPATTDAALVLDDLDKLNPTPHSLQPLYVAINGWIEKPLPLLVTMNRSPDELAEWAGETFGEALASRLVGYSRVVEVKGRDRRMD